MMEGDCWVFPLTPSREHILSRVTRNQMGEMGKPGLFGQRCVCSLLLEDSRRGGRRTQRFGAHTATSDPGFSPFHVVLLHPPYISISSSV